jgi:flagellar hook assembly protein FlgD
LSVGSNPCVGQALVRVRIDREKPADVRIVDVRGRTVRVLARQALGPGTHQWTWNGADERGADAGAGLFYLVASAGDSGA